jgi:hypothetical protein
MRSYDDKSGLYDERLDLTFWALSSFPILCLMIEIYNVQFLKVSTLFKRTFPFLFHVLI